MNSLMDATAPFLLNAVFPPLSEFEPYLEGQFLTKAAPWGHSPNSLRFWLQTNIKEWDLAPTTWAKRAGVAPSTVNRFLEGSDQEASLSARTIKKLSAVIEEEVQIRAKSDRISYEKKLGASKKDVVEAQFLGSIGGDQWHRVARRRANDEYGPYDIRVVSVPAAYSHQVVGAFEIETDIYEPVFNKFDEIICSPISKTNIEPVHNQYVILIEFDQEKSWRGKLLQYVKDPFSREWLLPVGDRAAKVQSGIFLNSALDAGKILKRVVFTVIGHYRNLNDIAAPEKRENALDC